MALCTQDDVENRLQITFDNDPDAVVASLIADAQSLIEAEVGRTLESAARTETLDGGRVTYFLKWWPVTTMTSVTEDTTALTVDTEFMWYESGKLIRVGASGFQRLWTTRKQQSIDVAYTGGYLSGHSDEHDMALEHLGSICAEMVARAFRKGADAASIPAGAAGQIQSVSLAGSDTVTYATGGDAMSGRGAFAQFIFLEENEQVQLGRYKRTWLGFA